VNGKAVLPGKESTAGTELYTTSLPSRIPHSPERSAGTVKELATNERPGETITVQMLCSWSHPAAQSIAEHMK